MITKLKDIFYSLVFRERVYISSDSSLAGTVVLITGGTQGIGKATAEVLQAKGANIAVLSRSRPSHFIENPKLMFVQCDITHPSECESAVSAVLHKYGTIDVLFNNAGVYVSTQQNGFSQNDTDSMIDTNIKGMIAMCDAIIPYMKEKRKGLIINMGSYISHNPHIESGRSIYAATKYAVEGYSTALAQELIKYKIRVTCLMPGTVKTFRTVTPNKYISPYTLAEMISFLIKQKSLSVESIAFTSFIYK